MNYIKLFIKKILGQKMIDRTYYILGFRYYSEFFRYKNKKKIIHISTPLHGNMGDQAIVYATNEFLKKEFSEYEIIEIYKKDIYKYTKAIKRILNKDDIIVLIGGGNMGNLWIDEERDRRFIIEKFPENKIISMPQTISFTKDENGQKELNKTIKIYNRHKNLTIIAREKISFEIMKKQFVSANVILNPDTVLYLHNMYKPQKSKRNRIMTCLRSDKESILGNEKLQFIHQLKDAYDEVFNYDTVINKCVTKEKRENELKNMFEEFLKSKVVITDRLHGMVFCAITKTPCIVTKSLDHKVTGTYEWIKELNYIRLVDDLKFEKIKPLIEELSNLTKINEINFTNIYFNNLTQTLKSNSI
jgi:pyruvyl transferase EpsI